MRTNFFKKKTNKLKFLIKWWNWKQLKVYKSCKKKIKKKNNHDQIWKIEKFRLKDAI